MSGSEVFGNLLNSLISRAHMTQAEFARRVGAKAPFVQMVRQGTRTPTPKAISTWADVLGLEGEDRDRFLWLAAVAHIPKPIQSDLERLVERHIKLYRDYTRLVEEERRKR